MKGSREQVERGVAATSALPGVEGPLGQKPIVRATKSSPPASFQIVPISSGAGSKVIAGQTLAAKVVGVTWGGREVLSTWEENGEFVAPDSGVLPASVQTGLVGTSAGSRLLVIVPPTDGFDAARRETLGLTADDTVVFVIDLFGSF